MTFLILSISLVTKASVIPQAFLINGGSFYDLMQMCFHIKFIVILSHEITFREKNEIIRNVHWFTHQENHPSPFHNAYGAMQHTSLIFPAWVMWRTHTHTVINTVPSLKMIANLWKRLWPQGHNSCLGGTAEPASDTPSSGLHRRPLLTRPRSHRSFYISLFCKKTEKHKVTSELSLNFTAKAL